MEKQTRESFNKFIERQAQLNNIPVVQVASQFTVEPAIEQKLEERIKASSDFLSKVNLVTVAQMKGDKVGIGVSSTIAGRTDTSADKERVATDVSSLDEQGYELFQTNYDTGISYNKLDAWAHKPEFQKLLRAAISKQIARDRLMIAFNGEKAAKTTDRATNKLLQDVNVGWLKLLKEGRTEAVSSVGVQIGADKDIKNLDALVTDAIANLIGDVHQDATDLVVICGRDLVHEKEFTLINNHNEPTEKNALNTYLVNKTMGGLRAIVVPFFPKNSLMITSLDNLSIYVQRGSTRLTLRDHAPKNRVEEFRSVNDGFVIEDLTKACLVEKIKIV